MNICVLGCGPAGLLVTHAAVEDGHDVSIISHKRRSVIGGAQYVHKQIPGVSGREPDIYVRYIKQGEPEGYARKVYGSDMAATSWRHFPEGWQSAWSMDKVYRKLWYLYSDKVKDEAVSGWTVPALVKEYDVVFSTVPRVALCRKLGNMPGDHQFPHVPVWFEPKLPAGTPPWGNFILYNGDPDYGWYRASRLGEEVFTEWAGRPVQKPRAGWLGIKPLETNCDCHPGIVMLGRFGRWRKGVLTHHAYQGALDHLAAMETVGDVQ